jgi:hypothetical protein
VAVESITPPRQLLVAAFATTYGVRFCVQGNGFIHHPANVESIDCIQTRDLSQRSPSACVN